MNAFLKIITYSVIAQILCSCTVGEQYHKPELKIPSNWYEKHTDCKINFCVSPENWWNKINDKTLIKLIDFAILNNNDLKIMAARIDEANAISNKNKSELAPDILISSSATREGNQSSRGGGDYPHSKWEAGIDGTWDLDIFGGKRAIFDASYANALGAQVKYKQALLILIADVGKAYIDMRTMEKLHRLTVKNYNLQEETFHTTKLQYESKAASKLDLLRAEAQAQSTKAKIPLIKISLAAARNRLAVLVGKNPGEIDGLLNVNGSIPKFMNSIILNTPIVVIASRPDVRAAEYSLIEATALKNSVSSEVFPKLTLSGFLGIGGSGIFGYSNPWSIGANALMPLLNFGRIENKVKAADARKMQAFYNYKQVVIKAIEEVENSLTAYNSEVERRKYFSLASESYNEAARLARIKYKAGDTSFLDVLIAEERLLSAQTDEVISIANVSKNAIVLYTALGMTNLPN